MDPAIQTVVKKGSGGGSKDQTGVGPSDLSAVVRLLGATASWGMSFSAAKALMLLQNELIPDRTSVFHASFILMNRMLLSWILMAAVFWRTLRGLKRAEVLQGVELGLFGGVGMLLQTDAQTIIPASTSAFFTQFTCIFVPLTVAIRSKEMPSFRVIASCVMVLLGCAILSGFGGGQGFGRGEWETIGAAALFTGQILVLERSRYAGNEMRNVACVMFGIKGALFFVFSVGCEWGGGGWNVAGAPWNAYGSVAMWGILAVLTVFSTAYGYATMLKWQPRVSATQAGLIYATEPVFATVWALFLPEWLSGLIGVSYANEFVTIPFGIGALFILGANGFLLSADSEKGVRPSGPSRD